MVLVLVLGLESLVLVLGLKGKVLVNITGDKLIAPRIPTPVRSLPFPRSRSASTTWLCDTVVGGSVTLTFAAAYDAYPVRPRLTVVACECHLAVPDDVINTPVLQRLRTRPHLDTIINLQFITHADYVGRHG